MSLGSIFGGIFTTAGTAVGSVFSTVKAYIIVAVVVLFVLMSGAFYWYYNYSQEEIQVLTANQAELQDALKQEKNSFEQLKKDSENLSKSYQDLQTKENQIQQQNDLLVQQIHSFDFQHNAIKNHDATEKTINQHSDQLFKDFQNLSDPNSFSGVDAKKGK